MGSGTDHGEGHVLYSEGFDVHLLQTQADAGSTTDKKYKREPAEHAPSGLATQEPSQDDRPRLASGYVKPSAPPQLKTISSGFTWNDTPSFAERYSEDPQVQSTLVKWGYVPVVAGQSARAAEVHK